MRDDQYLGLILVVLFATGALKITSDGLLLVALGFVILTAIALLIVGALGLWEGLVSYVRECRANFRKPREHRTWLEYMEQRHGQRRKR